MNQCSSVHHVSNVHTFTENPLCRRSAAKFLAGMTLPGFKSKDGFHLTGRVQPALQDETPCDKVTSDNQRICQSPQEQLLDSKTSSGKGRGSVLTDILQQVVSGSKSGGQS